MNARLVFHASPVVTIATNTFVNVPIILQYEETALIEVVKREAIGFTTQIPIYHSDGTYLAKVRGNRIYRTAEGKKAMISLEHPLGKTICKLGNREILVLTHGIGESFKAEAELYAPDGRLVKCPDSPDPEVIDVDGKAIRVFTSLMSQCTFQNVRIAVLLRRNGSVSFGVS